jgi:hypothetical protein
MGLYLQHGDYSAEGKKLKDTVLSLTEKVRPEPSYQDNFYNIVRLAQTSLDRNVSLWYFEG